MTGLDLETFLLLLRADLGAWATLGVAGVGLALLVWSSWGSRRVLRRCLVLSLAAHLGLVIYGSTVPAVRKVVRGGTPTRRTGSTSDRSGWLRWWSPVGRRTDRPWRRGADVSSDGPRLELAASAPTLADPRSGSPVRRSPMAGQRRRSRAAARSAGRDGHGDATSVRSGPEPPATGPRPESDAVGGGPPPAPAAPAPADLAELDRTTTAALPLRPPVGPIRGRSADGNRGDRARSVPRTGPSAKMCRLRPGRSGRLEPGGDRPDASSSAASGDEPRTGEARVDRPARMAGGGPSDDRRRRPRDRMPAAPADRSRSST